jgi:hypothetical protein
MTNLTFSSDLTTLLNSYQSVTTLEEIHLLASFLINVDVLELNSASDLTIQNAEVRKGIYPNLGMWMFQVFNEHPTNNTKRMELFTAARELAILKYTIIKNMDLKAELVKAESEELRKLKDTLAFYKEVVRNQDKDIQKVTNALNQIVKERDQLLTERDILHEAVCLISTEENTNVTNNIIKEVEDYYDSSPALLSITNYTTN